MPDAKPLSPERLAEIERMCNAATPGPWWTELRESSVNFARVHGDEWPIAQVYFDDDRRPVESEFDAGKHVVADAKLIALCRTAIPELLSEVRRLSADLHLAARITSFSPEPCPLCLSLAGEVEVCALHHEIDEAGFAAQRHAKRIGALEVEVGEAIEQRDVYRERSQQLSTRIATLEAGLGEACVALRLPGSPGHREIEAVRLEQLVGGASGDAP